MSETKWTPGPWEARRDLGNRQHWLIYGTEQIGERPNRYFPTVAKTAFWLTTDSWDEEEANARLIAAAPELYEALANLLESNDVWPTSPFVVAARAALAKARGDQP